MARPGNGWQERIAIVGAGLTVASLVAVAVVARSRFDPAPSSDPSTSATSVASASSQHEHRMGDPPVPAPPLDAAERRAIRPQLAAAQRAVPWRTVGDALDAGYRRLTVDPAHPDDHLVLDERVDDRFVVAAPEMLIASSNRRSGRILAAVYWVEGMRPPGGFVGPSDVWHHHPGACRVDGIVGADGDLGDPAVCRRNGGTVVSPGGWMIHAWVLPAFPNPAGTFAVNDPELERQLRRADAPR